MAGCGLFGGWLQRYLENERSTRYDMPMATAPMKPSRNRVALLMNAVTHALWNTHTLVAIFVVAVVWTLGCGFIYSEMRKPPEQFGHFMMKLPGPVAFLAFPFETMWMRARAGTLEIGDHAPDFALTKIDHTGQVELSDLNRTQPVVLIFGSYT
jgi:hypothetical protein